MDRKNAKLNIAPIIKWANETKITSADQAKSLKSKPDSILKELEGQPFKIPDGTDGKDYLTMLLHFDAEIEHGLMIQYLYAAYSIGGPQVPQEHRDKVKVWQEIILGVAKEEMGHFISVQNVLKLIGSPLNFGRESYPWDTPFYPFPFTLEKFSFKSLAKYIYAEAPKDWLAKDEPLQQQIKELVNSTVSDPHTVGALFKVILQLIKDPKVIKESDFQPKTFPYQAKFDEWGRGYSEGHRGNNSNKFLSSPDVLVAPLLSRDDAVKSLNKIAEQGEGDEVDENVPSHFERFLFIYQEMRAIFDDKNEKWEPARNVVANPLVLPDESEKEMEQDAEDNLITHPETKLWAKLFNLRYRMLLNYLNHSFLLDNGNNAASNVPRGMIIGLTFGEMYNLRSIATILVCKPVSTKSPNMMAGPPFTIPYSMDLPFGENNRWRLHEDLLHSSQSLVSALKESKENSQPQFLNALSELDDKLLIQINQTELKEF
jgi:hypothetical protein